MHHPLQNAFPIVAAALGRRLGVRVEIHGDQARTNGDVIQLPALSNESTDDRDIAWGFLAHEAGHLRWTDFDVFRASGTHPLRQSLLNVVEDIRIERQLKQMYPGTRRSLETTVGRVLAEGGFDLPPSSAHPGALLQAHCLLALRTQILGQRALVPKAAQARSQLERIMGSTWMGALDSLLVAVDSLKSTREGLDLVDRLLTLFSRASAPETAGEPATPEDRALGASSGTSAPRGPLGDDVSKDTERLSPMDWETTPAEDLMADPYATAGQLLDRGAQSHSGPTLPIADDPPSLGQESRTLLEKARMESLSLRASLESLVQASVERHARHSGQGLKVDGNRLARSRVLDPRVFVRRTQKSHPDTAVHLLLDRSPSMSALVTRPQGGSARRIDLAWEATLALTLALEAIPGVNPAITAFPGAMGEATRVYRVLPHGRRLNTVRDHLGSDLDGSTPLAEALLYAASELLGTPCQRKVILCLTDGIPDDLEAAISILGQIRVSGIDVYGIGLALDVARVFGPSIQIADLGALRSALFDLCRSFLTLPH